jgi:glycosyltransferase involved in cell wall biosynthesis
MSISTDTRRSDADAPQAESSGRYVHICNGLDPIRDGGMVPSILGMTGALAAQGGRVTIVTPTESRLGDTSLPPGIDLQGPEFRIDSALKSAGVVHIHGLWQAQSRRGAQLARRHRVPYLVAAHGMAEPWAMRRKFWKKRIYTALIEGTVLRRAACLHALTRPEVGHLRALAPATPVALVPNGVDLSPFDDLPDRSEFDERFPECAGKFLLLFFSRLHVKKGLDLLAAALGSVAADWPELHVVLAGNDDGAKQPFDQQIRDLGLGDRVTFLGHASGEAARRAWGAADAFVLPSYSEGFSMAILEALAARLPAIITTACHFPELRAVEGAITVNPTTGDVTQGLRTLWEMSPAERLAMADRGRRLVESRYTWDRQAERLADLYGWLDRGGTEPAAVSAAKEVA